MLNIHVVVVIYMFRQTLLKRYVFDNPKRSFLVLLKHMLEFSDLFVSYFFNTNISYTLDELQQECKVKMLATFWISCNINMDIYCWHLPLILVWVKIYVLYELQYTMDIYCRNLPLIFVWVKIYICMSRNSSMDSYCWNLPLIFYE